MKNVSYKVVNAITIYRILAAPVLIFLIFTEQFDLFKWLLPFSFFTDLIDGFLARKYKVESILGSRLDSIGDDLTVLAAITGLILFDPDFIRKESFVLIFLFSLFLVQILCALIRYGRLTSFHTYLAKTAALFQGVFFILYFLFSQPLIVLFYAAAVITALDLIEEIIIVFLLPEWEANVKGIYWLNRRKKNREQS